MLRMTEFIHDTLRQTLRPGDWAVDATVGNGYDTAFLAEQVGASGRVFGFDIQADAIEATKERTNHAPWVALFQCSHERMSKCLPANAKGKIAVVMFNLGYLPGGQKDITTTPETTVDALHEALELIKAGGLVTLLLYTGHPGGQCEAAAVKDVAAALPSTFVATEHRRLNAAKKSPEVLLIRRNISSN